MLPNRMSTAFYASLYSAVNTVVHEGERKDLAIISFDGKTIITLRVGKIFF